MKIQFPTAAEAATFLSGLATGLNGEYSDDLVQDVSHLVEVKRADDFGNFYVVDIDAVKAAVTEWRA